MPKVEIEFVTPDQQLIELCQDYWRHEESGRPTYPLKRLSERHSIKISRIERTVADACLAFVPEQSCVRCQCPKRLKGRQEYRKYLAWRHFQKPRICETCEEQERTAKQQLVSEALRRDLERRRTCGSLMHRLSFRDVIFLVSLLRTCGSQDATHIAPVAARMLTPTPEFDERLIWHLFSNNLICVDAVTAPEAVQIEGNVIVGVDMRSARWTLPLPEGVAPADFLDMLEEMLAGTWPDDWAPAAQRLRLDVAVERCVQYLDVLLTANYMRPASFESARSVFRCVLQTFSISQAYFFIWQACRYAMSLHREKHVPRHRASSTIPKTIQRSCELAITQQWNVQHYRRDTRAPDSSLCRVLFTSALKLPHTGFLEIPSR